MTKTTERRIAYGFVLAAVTVGLAFFTSGNPGGQPRQTAKDEADTLLPDPAPVSSIGVTPDDISPPEAATRFAKAMARKEAGGQVTEVKALLPALIENEHFLAVLDVLEPQFRSDNAWHTEILHQILTRWTRSDLDSVLTYLAQPQHTDAYLSTIAQAIVLELKSANETEKLAAVKVALEGVKEGRPASALSEVIRLLAPDAPPGIN